MLAMCQAPQSNNSVPNNGHSGPHIIKWLKACISYYRSMLILTYLTTLSYNYLYQMDNRLLSFTWLIYLDFKSFCLDVFFNPTGRISLKIFILAHGKSGTTVLNIEDGGLPDRQAFAGNRPGKYLGDYENVCTKAHTGSGRAEPSRST